MTESTVRPKRCAKCGHVLGAEQRPLTRVQARVLKYIGESIARDGCAPRYADIARHFDWLSLATVAEHLENLEAKGYIRRDPGVVRGITVLIPFDEIGTFAVEKR